METTVLLAGFTNIQANTVIKHHIELTSKSRPFFCISEKCKISNCSWKIKGDIFLPY
jgi:hypothetical protein